MYIFKCLEYFSVKCFHFKLQFNIQRIILGVFRMQLKTQFYRTV
uniref:Uncharacterized protein n=1 Tax=Anguilla anguilla TaxID=7936 RepID=A0A0E9SJS4_ANGAN